VPSSQRHPPDEASKLRAKFLKCLLHKHHTMIAAWVALDTKKQGRLSYYQFLTAIRELGYYGSARQVWEAFDHDRNGFVSLYELDERTARLIEGFAVSVWAACGTVQFAWDKHFDRRGLGRCSPESFAAGCREIGFTGDIDGVYKCLNSEQCACSIGASQFEFLQLWFAPKKKMDKVSAFHPHVDKETADIRAAAAAHAKAAPAKRVAGAREVTAKDKFKRQLINTYGNFVRAWREGLDFDKNGRLDYQEFQRCCADIGYPGPRQPVWDELDVHQEGEVTLAELDEATAHNLESFVSAVMNRYGTWEECWVTHFDHKGLDRVELQDWRNGCLTLGWGGNVDRLFDCLDTERTKYLSYQSCSWIAGEDFPEQAPLFEVAGGMKLSGAFKKVTKSQQRRLDQSAREERLRQRRFETRNRLEMSASMAMSDPGPKAFHGSQSTSALLSATGGTLSSLDASPTRSRFAHSAARYYPSDPFPVPPPPPPPAAPAKAVRARLDRGGHPVAWRLQAQDLPKSYSVPNFGGSLLEEPSFSQMLLEYGDR